MNFIQIVIIKYIVSNPNNNNINTIGSIANEFECIMVKIWYY